MSSVIERRILPDRRRSAVEGVEATHEATANFATSELERIRGNARSTSQMVRRSRGQRVDYACARSGPFATPAGRLAMYCLRLRLRLPPLGHRL